MAQHDTESPRPPTAQPADLYGELAREDADDRQGMRVSLALAALIHGALLMVTIPELYSREVDDAPEKPQVFVVKPIRFKSPVVPPERIPRQQTKRVPIPDPTPDEPEPLPRAEPEPTLELPPIDDVFGIPDQPPEPEHVGPAVVGVEVEPPVRVHYVQPRYPEIARRARIEGIVILQAVVDTSGNVTEVKVLKPLTFGLAEEAVNAVKQWRFEPSTLRGKPVPVLYTLTVHFNLQ